MPLYYVPILLVIEAKYESSVGEISQRLVDNLVGLLPRGLEGVARVDNLESSIPASYGGVDMTHNLVLKEGTDKFTVKEENEGYCQ